MTHPAWLTTPWPGAITLQETPAPPPPLPRPVRRRLLLDFDQRIRGLFIGGAPGSGKTVQLARIALHDLLCGLPTAIIDPTGAVTELFLFWVSLLPSNVHRLLFERIRWAPLNPQPGYVFPWPLLPQPTASEPLGVGADRFLQTLDRADPAYKEAPLNGVTAAAPLIGALGRVLPALGKGYTEAESFLRHPTRWYGQLNTAKQRHPQLAKALDVLHDFADETKNGRSTPSAGTAALLNRLTALTSYDQAHEAMFGSLKGIDWDQVQRERLCVLVDLKGSDEHPIRRRFKLLYAFSGLLASLRRRPNDRRQRPFSLLIDEVSFLCTSAWADATLLGTDLNELIAILSRQHRVMTTIATQELDALPPPIAKTLLKMGNLMLGATGDYDTALALAKRFLQPDPYLIKKVERVWVSYLQMPTVVDERTVEWTFEEQFDAAARMFLGLRPLHFLMATTGPDGSPPTRLRHLVASLPPAETDHERVAEIKSRLIRRHGLKIDTALAEIAQRTAKLPPPTPRQGGRGSPPEASPTPPPHPPGPGAIVGRSSPRREAR